MAITLNPDLSIKVIYKSDGYLAVSKPAGMHCHPLSFSETDTVLNVVAARYPEVAQTFREGKPLEGGLLHRLDEGTSGVLLFARSQQGFDCGRKAWKTKSIEKVYIAAVHGALQGEGTVRLLLEHDPKSRRRMRVVRVLKGPAISEESIGKGQWLAETAWQSLFVRDGAQTLVLLSIHTGVMHQIRCTMQWLGHVILEDAIYKQKPARSSGVALSGLTQKDVAVFDKIKREIEARYRSFPKALDAFQFRSKIRLDGARHALHSAWIRVPEIAGLERGILDLP